MGLALGLILGIAGALLRNSMDRRVREPDDLRHHHFAVLGSVPSLERLIERNFQGNEMVSIATGEVNSTVAAALHPLSPLAEAMRHIRTNIRFSLPDRTVQAILVTSTGPQEGKTTTAVNLAVSMAQAGQRTLLIDADLRKPMIHSRLGLRKDRGLTELLFLTSEFDWEQFRCPLRADWGSFDTSVDDLYVVPTGSRVPNPAELLGSNRMRQLLDEMRQHFDVIIIDSPPVLAVADPAVLAGLSDASVMVAVSGRTDLRALERVREQLEMAGTPILGVILNRYRVNRSRYGGYGPGYGYGYGATDDFISSGDGMPAARMSHPPLLD